MTTVGIVAGASRRHLRLHRAYVDAVIAAGGTPLLVPSALVDHRLAEALRPAGALLLTGGGDIQPERYGAVASTTLLEVDLDRDEAELRAFRAARERGLRVLGVCRGAQIMAVATGGTLVQDLPARGLPSHLDASEGAGYAALRHPVKTEPGSLADHLLAGMDTVNSHHHQAIADPGELLRPTAWAPDGVIEAVEGPDVLGVQWHPELDVRADRRHLRAFQWLVHGERGRGDGS
ncbi:gamma-glutamyl-gamma-aminobutyrate hydrolase family protein [Actinomadura viridis]|uniref:gamma-glutamyl-gamma-aminobutyrate hydrolase family protein n=1 Tax=Actinomadura viridis TaxID=58110 RepID=UPI003699A3E6